MEIDSMLKEMSARNGIGIELDENRACTLELSDGRAVLLQERAALNELDFVATLGPVPEEVRAAVFAELLAANFYWQETFGATLSWNADLEEVVLIYPFPLTGATSDSMETVFARFVDLQSAWAARFAALVAAAQDRRSDADDADDADDDSDDSAETGTDGNDATDNLIINPYKTLRGQMLLAGGSAPDIRLGDSDVPGEVTHFYLARRRRQCHGRPGRRGSARGQDQGEKRDRSRDLKPLHRPGGGQAVQREHRPLLARRLEALRRAVRRGPDQAAVRAGGRPERPGRTIRIRPSILKFNFGVNEGAVNTLFKIAPDAAGGWDLSSQMNRNAFTSLRRQVNAFLRTETDQRKKVAIITLFEQCRQALDGRAERRDAHDAFKVAARIAVLANLMGDVPCWNCKSGKDRTGQMDVECKFLSTLIARGDPIPEPGAPLTKEQQSLLRSIALEGGNFEVQKMNTAIAGFKTGRVDSVAERLGGQEFREFHRGGSDHVSV